MLTKTDLNQIRGVVRDEVGEIVDQKLEPIKKNINGLVQDVTSLKKDMSNVKRDVKYLRKTANVIVKNYDEGDVMLGRRVKKIEQHLGLPTGN